ncbi:D-glycero-alpha-D-manno-heptose-1,7-bisphosphate 7-phosphatase [Caulobacter sp. LARHSG274]
MSTDTPLKAVFFDRDGVLNLDHGYVCDPERLDWIPGAREAVARLNAADVRVLVVTNQSGVARGYFTEEQVDLFHAALQARLAEVGGRIDAFYVAPHHEDAAVERYRHPDHPDRKPNPGMVLRGLADWSLRPEETVLVGDKESDIEAARRAGVEGLQFPGGDLLAFLRQVLGARFPAGDE